VHFGEQLGFQVKEALPLPSEMLSFNVAQPIEFRNNFKVPSSSNSAAKALLKGKVNKGTLKQIKKTTAVPPKALPEFNLDTRPKKYFDPALEAKTKRTEQVQVKRPTTTAHKVNQPVV
jgi:hypothetical protein